MITVNLATVELAREVALRLHGSALYGSRPYRFHLEAGIDVLRRFGQSTPLREAAFWLHDTCEDAGATRALLTSFGIPSPVIDIVELVSDEDGPTRKIRKTLTLRKLAGHREAIAVKLPDRITNVESGGTEAMYAREHAAFRSALYDPSHGFDAMWSHLDLLLNPYL